MTANGITGPSPIAALAVNMAVSPGGYAVLIGSGFSRAAGCPSAWDVLVDIAGRWYAAEQGEPPAADVDVIEWSRQRLEAEPTYSLLLERLFPQREQRQALLASYFVGKRPTEAHKVLAGLAQKGLVRVVVTTNFDRLTEAALDEAGVNWSRVTTASEIDTAQPREVAPSYILKLHGDYGSIDIRNTTDEIDALDPRIEEELQAIIRTHGLVVSGYAGSDPAVARNLSTIRPRLGLYWSIRGAPTASQADIAAAVDGRFVIAEDADSFFRDLLRRVNALTAAPAARTPVDLYRTTVNLLRMGDQVGLREVIKENGAGVIDSFEGWRESAARANVDWRFSPTWGLAEWQPRIDRFVDELGPLVEALLSIGLALAEYRREDLPVLLSWLDRLRARCLTLHGGVPPPVDGACADVAAASLLGIAAGALALRAWRSFGVVMTWPDSTGRRTRAVFNEQLHHYQFFDTYAWPMPHAQAQLLAASTVWQNATRERREPIEFILWTGILIAVQAEALGANSILAAIWSFNWNHWTRGVEDLLRTIARDDELAAVLAEAIGESPETYRAEFVARYEAAFAKVRGEVFFGGEPLNRVSLRSALGISPDT